MGKCNYTKELKIGEIIELEHKSLFPKSKQKQMAKKIAEQHIAEFPCYYTKGLVPMEKKLRRKK